LPAQPPYHTPSEIEYLAADAKDRRAALAAATTLITAFGDRREWPPWVRGAREDLDGWLAVAARAYRWLQERDSLKAIAIQLDPSMPTTEGQSSMTTSLNLEDDDQIAFTLSGVDAKGIQVDAPADTWTWSSDDTAGAIVTLTVSDDTTSAEVAAVAPGTATISVSGGNTGLQGAEAIIVTAGPAVTIDLVAGEPEPETA
jgi:hypothetical protein